MKGAVIKVKAGTEQAIRLSMKLEKAKGGLQLCLRLIVMEKVAVDVELGLRLLKNFEEAK